MGIVQFFKTVLGSPLKTPYSWGSIHPCTGGVYLRVWEEDFSTVDGYKVVMVLDPEIPFQVNSATTMASYRQRQRHVKSIEDGARSFCVVCRGRDQKRMISFDSDRILVGGPILLREDVSKWLIIKGEEAI